MKPFRFLIASSFASHSSYDSIVIETPVEELRDELRKLGYLHTGIERWFVPDSPHSRTFRGELLTVGAKSAVLMTPFVLLPLLIVMSLQNRRLNGLDLITIAALELPIVFSLAFAVTILVSLLIRLRPGAFVERQRLLLATAIGTSAILPTLLTAWWSQFDRDPAPFERLSFATCALALFGVGSYVLYAAFLSFSIHESGVIPTVRQGPRGRWILLLGTALLAFVILPVAIGQTEPAGTAAEPVVVAQTDARIAILGVDGLSFDLGSLVLAELPSRHALELPRHTEPTELWATLATGTAPRLHGVHSIDGIVLEPSGNILQSVSRIDFPLRSIAPVLSLARRVALPPAVRERDYVWEVMASRGLPVTAINWWTAGRENGALRSIPQEEVFRAARTRAQTPAELALAVDREAARLLLASLNDSRVASVYLPSLDVLRNRITLSAAGREKQSELALSNLASLVGELRRRGWIVMVAGADAKSGRGIVASTIPLAAETKAADIAPTLLDLAGFPRSREMSGESRLPNTRQEVIASFGDRENVGAVPTDAEYFENLRSLGYIK